MEQKLNLEELLKPSERTITIWTSAEGIELFNKAVREQYEKLNMKEPEHLKYMACIDHIGKNTDCTIYNYKPDRSLENLQRKKEDAQTYMQQLTESLKVKAVESELPPNYTYRPLPEGLYIGNSAIEGNGLFTRKSFVAYHNFGTTHHLQGEELIRTPLGGFINHSKTPNCVITNFGDCKSKVYWLLAIRYILPGEELTVNYYESSCGKSILNKDI